MAEFRQTSFGSGELSPTMWGRTDLAQYEHGLRRCYNFVITPHGAATLRPGLRYIGDLPAGNYARMFPLVVSTGESYILVFGPNYVRIYRRVTTGDLPFTELSTPYTSSQLFRLKFQQIGRGVLVLCPGVQPHEIRGSGSSWEITEFTVVPQLSPPPKLYPVWGNTNLEQPTTPPRVVPNRAIYGFSVVYRHIATDTYHETSFSRDIVNGYGPDLGSYSPVRKENGDLEFSKGNPWLGHPVGGGASDLEKQPTRTVFIKRYPNMPVPDGYEFHSFRLYKGVLGSVPSFYRQADGVWGLLAEATENPQKQDVIINFNISTEPNYAVPPRRTHGGFVVYRENGLDDYRHPTVGAFHDQRLVLAAPQEEPGKLWFSQVNSIDNFDLYPLPAAHHALTLELASTQLEEIRSLVSHHSLLVFTDRNVWAIDGADRGPIAVGSAVARIHVNVGSSHLPPLVLGSDVLFTNPLANRIYRLRYDGRTHSYYAEDVSIFSRHLFQDSAFSGVQAWTAATDIATTVWIARGDGSFLTYTYAPDSGVFAFAQHETGPGDAVLDFCTIPTGGGDVTYALVRRSRGDSYRIQLEQVDDSVHLDSYVSDLRTIPQSRKDEVAGLYRLNGRKVMVVAGVGSNPKVVLGPFTVSAGRVSFDLPTLPGEKTPQETPFYTVSVGLPYVGELELLDFPVEKLRVKTISKVGWEVLGSRGLLTGEDFDNLYEWTQTTIADVYGPAPASGLAEVVIGSTWNKHGRAVLRQPLPLPLTVLGVTREGSLGG